MSDSTKEILKTINSVLFHCWIFGFVVLLIWVAVVFWLSDMIVNVHGSLLGLSKHCQESLSGDRYVREIEASTSFIQC